MTIPPNAICVDLRGGFGNQMFGFAAGLAVARRLDVPLVLDASLFSRPDEPRSYALQEVAREDFLVLHDLGPKQGIRRRRSNASFGALPHVFRESGFSFDPRVLEVRPGTVLNGNFQSWRYFESSAVEIEARLRSASSGLTPLPEATTMHVRRGDYTHPKFAAHHGLADLAYFSRAHEVTERLHGRGPVRMFTDSPELVQEAFAARWPEMRLENGLAGEPDAVVVNRMAQSGAFIMSNSSFSWWAAWLSARANGGPVIAPRPWFASGESAADLLLPDWLTLDAR